MQEEQLIPGWNKKEKMQNSPRFLQLLFNIMADFQPA